MPVPHETVEYAIMRGKLVVFGPSEHPQWNDELTYGEAIHRWYPGARLVKRVRTRYEDDVTDWADA